MINFDSQYPDLKRAYFKFHESEGFPDYSPKIHQSLSPTSKGSHVWNKFRQNYRIHFIYRPETFS